VKTMTCKQLGGPCDLMLRGDTPDEVIKLQDKHLKERVSEGDHTHADAAKEMKSRWRHPISGMAWYKQTKRDFAALSDD
jgi:predicted small metal-binding protein